MPEWVVSPISQVRELLTPIVAPAFWICGLRLDKAAKHFEKVQHRFNRNMAQLYLEDLTKKKKDRDFLSVNSFLMTRKDYIFTSKQMKELLMMIGLSEEKATNKAYNFKKHHTIEYFKKEDLDYIIADIKAKITDYFAK